MTLPKGAVLLPPCPVQGERTAWVARRHSANRRAQTTAGVDLRAIPVEGHDEDLALSRLEDALLAAVADVRRLREDLRLRREHPPTPRSRWRSRSVHDRTRLVVVDSVDDDTRVGGVACYRELGAAPAIGAAHACSVAAWHDFFEPVDDEV